MCSTLVGYNVLEPIIQKSLKQDKARAHSLLISVLGPRLKLGCSGAQCLDINNYSTIEHADDFRMDTCPAVCLQSRNAGDWYDLT